MRLKDSTLLKDRCLIDGAWVSAVDGAVMPVTNPADGSTIGAVPRLGRAETARAVAAAEKARPAWEKLRPLQRAAILRRWHALIAENIEDLATIMTVEQGKPLAEARGEIAGGLSYIEWFAEEGRRVYGEVIPSPWEGKQPLTIRRPIGVTAAITPWNFPMSMIPRKAAPALAAGCPVIVKPSGKTPYSALALGELAVRAGVPAGVLAVLTGDASEIGGELCADPTVRKLSFTGSTAVGKELLAACAGTVKKVSLELGGNAPLIVCVDADLGKAVAGAVSSKFRNSGQTCICANRILVHESIHERFVAAFAEQVGKLVTGNGLEPGVTQGPLIDASAHAAMSGLVEDAVAKGATVVLGGKPHTKGGLFFEPTILTGVTPAMRVFREEIFGPIAPIISFSTDEEAAVLANDTEYGLAAYLFTRDLGRFYRLAEALQYGMVGVNEVILATGEVPFGGIKHSGLGREGGRQGIEDYLETQYILLGGLAD